MKTLILAHYYTTPEVQKLAHKVGDSLDLAIEATLQKPDRIIFAGVRFMAETAKILNPDTEVILPDAGSTCSLVTQTDVKRLAKWRKKFADHVHVAYINSSAQHKALADIIVTSRIVDEVIEKLFEMRKNVIFSPDKNMGKYLNYTVGHKHYKKMPLWNAVCEVHDKFKADELEVAMRPWTNGGKYVLAHPESPLPILQKADYVGSTHGMLNWIREFPYNLGTIWVATEEGLLYNMRELRPELDIRQAPMYSGCQCNHCPYMKLNDAQKIEAAYNGYGTKIDYLTEQEMEQARAPIERMLEYQRTGELPWVKQLPS